MPDAEGVRLFGLRRRLHRCNRLPRASEALLAVLGSLGLGCFPKRNMMFTVSKYACVKVLEIRAVLWSRLFSNSEIARARGMRFPLSPARIQAFDPPKLALHLHLGTMDLPLPLNSNLKPGDCRLPQLWGSLHSGAKGLNLKLRRRPLFESPSCRTGRIRRKVFLVLGLCPILKPGVAFVCVCASV